VLDSLILYAGGALFAGGAASTLRRTMRSRGVVAAVSGAVMIAVALSLPIREKRVATRTTSLDDWMPLYEFDERHEIEVDAPPDVVYRAIRDIRASDITLFQTLTAIRRGFCDTGPPTSRCSTSRRSRAFSGSATTRRARWSSVSSLPAA
jgi:hypothetical protein